MQDTRTTVNAALYHGIDTRMNVYELDKKARLYPDLPTIKKRLEAVACLISEGKLIEKENRYDLRPGTPMLSQCVSPRFEHTPFASGEKFADEPAPGFGSAFFIEGGKGKWILTAGHCLCKRQSFEVKSRAELDDIRIVFRYHKTAAGRNKTRFDKGDVYRIKKILHHSYSESGRDYALVKLDRPVKGIEPIPVAFSAIKNQGVYVLGCPEGMAVKCAGLNHATIKKLSPQLIESDLDIVGGNSGSPILDRTSGRAIAILVRGAKDYTVDTNYNNTGVRRVVNLRATSDTPYAVGQRIIPEMVDRYGMIAKMGREARKALSNEQSNRFEKETRQLYYPPAERQAALREKKICTGWIAASSIFLPLAPFALPAAIAAKRDADVSLRIIRENKAYFDRVRRIRGNKSNFMESCTIDQLQGTHQTSLPELGKVARNMCAYSMLFENADLLYRIEEQFERKFAPEKILSYMEFQADTGWFFDEEFTRNILKRLHKNNYCNDAEQKELTERINAVREAVIQEHEKFFKTDPRLNNYSEAELKAISRYIVEQGPETSLETAGEELGYPYKVLDPEDLVEEEDSGRETPIIAEEEPDPV